MQDIAVYSQAVSTA